MTVKVLSQEEQTEIVISNLTKVAEILTAIKEVAEGSDRLNAEVLVDEAKEALDLLSLAVDDIVPLSFEFDSIEWGKRWTRKADHFHCSDCTHYTPSIDDGIN